MSLLGAYKKKTSYDGYESLQLVDSGGDGFSIGRGSSGGGGSGGTQAASSVGAKAAVGPLREEDCSTMDSSGRTAEGSTLWFSVGCPQTSSDGDGWSVTGVTGGGAH